MDIQDFKVEWELLFFWKGNVTPVRENGVQFIYLFIFTLIYCLFIINFFFFSDPNVKPVSGKSDAM